MRQVIQGLEEGLQSIAEALEGGGGSSIVPTPSAADEGKVLKANDDGTASWGEVNGVPAGGSSGQVLTKIGNFTQWANPALGTYDTTEQVIGTWVDRRDVYRKLVPVDETWQNIGTGSHASFISQEDWVKDIDFVTNAIAVGSEEYYSKMIHISVQTDKGHGDADAYWNDAFGGSLTTMYVDYVILEYVKVSE